ncbi:MAG: transcription-repair coupling factor [bacterium]
MDDFASSPAGFRAGNFQGFSLALFLHAAACGAGGTVAVVFPSMDRAYRMEEEIAFLNGVEDRRVETLVLPGYSLPETNSPAVTLDTRRKRLRALERLYRGAADQSLLLLTTREGLLRRTLSREAYARLTKQLAAGHAEPPGRLAEFLADTGYEPCAAVEREGQFSRRGGVIDVFPASDMAPVRLEFLGDALEQIRLFDPATQRSSAGAPGAVVTPAWETVAPPAMAPPWVRPDHAEAIARKIRFDGGILYPVPFGAAASLPAEARFRATVVVDGERGAEEFDRSMHKDRAWLPREGFSDPDAVLEGIYLPEEEISARGPLFSLDTSQPRDGAGVSLPLRPLPPLPLDLDGMDGILRRECARGKVAVLSRYKKRLERHFGETGIRPDGMWEGDVQGGFRLDDVPLAVFTDSEVFARRPEPAIRRAPSDDRAPVLAPADIKPGDFVVHVDHGVGIYQGISTEATPDGEKRDFFSIKYAGNDRLFVPIEQIERIEKYIGGGKALPRIYPLHSGRWGRVKRRVSEKVEELAATLYRLYEERESIPGHAFQPDDLFMMELESSFPFDETPDQSLAISEVKRDMERAGPMDRLVCGDVGYGKTEVAVRAALKAALERRQVALIAPTTILAHQHGETFRRRLSRFPVSVEVLSRFKSRGEQKRILRRIASGDADVVIGTHRLLQKDVAFHDLGLLIIDEEQRFGVRQKEKIKLLRKNVDVLTLTATPIPRTLHMGLIGLRDVSLIETAPEERRAVKTFVEEWNMESLRLAVERELARDGQVFYLHNDVATIHRARAFLEAAFPRARVAVGHGKMPERELENTMIRFLAGEHDVLLCTTIIENGIDIPNANTLIVAGAENFGLAQLYQLRGRVGRSYRQSYAHFFYTPHRAVTDSARKRLEALKDFAELGSGYRLAMRDLEIRGAGNLLGREQHGYITEVGFNLFCAMLTESVGRLKGSIAAPPPKAAIELGLDAYIPAVYVADSAQRTSLYKRLVSARTEGEITAAADEIADRFGTPPRTVRNFLAAQRLRIACTDAGVSRMKTSHRNGTTDVHFRGRDSFEALRAAAPSASGGVELVFLKDRLRLIHKTVLQQRLPDEFLRLFSRLTQILQREH